MRVVLSLVAVCLPLLAVPAYADCAADIRAVVRAVIDAGPYSAVTLSKTGDVTTGITAEIAAEGEMHSWTNTGGDTAELIVLDGRAWTKTLGEWQEILPAVARGLGQTVARDRMAFLDGIEHPVCSGETVIKDRAFVGYSYSYAVEGTDSVSTLLVDPHTGMLSQMLTRSLAGGEITRSVTTFTFGETFEIKAPVAASK